MMCMSKQTVVTTPLSELCEGCRNYVARREHCNGTWINYFGAFVHTYGSEDSKIAGVLSQEDCAAVADATKCVLHFF